MIKDAAFSLDFKSSKNASWFLKQLLMNDEIAMLNVQLGTDFKFRGFI